METLIVICLLVVIVLLLQDKIIIKKVVTTKENKKSEPKTRLPDIMGLPKPVKRLSTPNTAFEGQSKKQDVKADNFDHEIKKAFDQQIPQEELDEVFGEVPDLSQEEEEWSGYGVSHDEQGGFAIGVTFEELGTVGMVLRNEVSEPSLEKQAVDIVHKIQGTELFSLLENSMEGASRRIAELLDRSLSSETDSGSSTMRNDQTNDFDIETFI